MTDVILRTRDLHRRFVTNRRLFRDPTVIHAVNGVTLEVRRGETFAIVGESGCGKSTLARLLLRLIEPSEGQVIYEGRDLTALPAAEMRALRAEMQFIFQDPFSSLNPRMTVEAIVGEPLRVHDRLGAAARRERVAQILARVGLRPEHANRYPHEFSGGQRQRISIARALASGPKLLIGDEPVSALDVSVQAQIVNLLEDLKQDFGLTLIVIAHDLAVIRHMSDRVAVMYLGEVVETAPTESLFARPRHPYTQALLQAIPVPVPPAPDGPARRTGGIGGDIPSPASPPSGCKFHTRCPHATALCRTTRPDLRDTGPAPDAGGPEAHAVACHYWDSIPTPQIGARLSQVRSPTAERRFALYREMSASKTPPSAATTTTSKEKQE